MTDDLSQIFQAPEGEPEREGPAPDLGRRRTERARQDHEEAFERLLARCRRLENEKLDWTGRSAADGKEIEALVAARTASDDRATDLERQAEALQGDLRESAGFLQESKDRLRETEDRLQRESADRLGEIETQHRNARAAAERETLDLQQAIFDMEDRHSAAMASRDEVDLAAARTHRAERDRMIDVHAQVLAEVETREETARHGLAKAEQDFRIEAYRLSALIMLKSKQAENAAAEATAARHQFAQVIASSSWRLTRPLRVLSRLIRRVGRAPRRLARILRSRS